MSVLYLGLLISPPDCCSGVKRAGESEMNLLSQLVGPGDIVYTEHVDAYCCPWLGLASDSDWANCSPSVTQSGCWCLIFTAEAATAVKCP